MAKLKYCKACGREVNPKYHTCPPIESYGVLVPGFFPMVFTEEQYDELKKMAKKAREDGDEAEA